MADLVELVGRDPAIQRALTSVFGKADASTVRLALYGTNEQAVAKGTMLAMPKMAKKLIAKPKPPPVPAPLASASG